MKAIKLILNLEEEKLSSLEAAKENLNNSPVPTQRQQAPAPVNESLEHLEMHMGNLESRLEYYAEENARLREQSIFNSERFLELLELEEGRHDEIEELQERERELQDEVHSVKMRMKVDRQRFDLRVAELESQLKAEREVNWNLRNLRVAESTRRLCRKLEELGQAELNGFDEDELRRRLLATTILAQDERKESDELREELRKTQIRLERAEKAHLRPQSTTIEEKQPEVPETVFTEFNGPIVNPFAQKRLPLQSKVSNLMVPIGAKTIKPKSGAVMNGFGAPSKVIKFSDGKSHFM